MTKLFAPLQNSKILEGSLSFIYVLNQIIRFFKFFVKSFIFQKIFNLNFFFPPYESVTFKMLHFAFVNKRQIPFVIILILTLIDKCKMCHFECNGLI
jgi:hypothetical protein